MYNIFKYVLEVGSFNIKLFILISRTQEFLQIFN